MLQSLLSSPARLPAGQAPFSAVKPSGRSSSKNAIGATLNCAGIRGSGSRKESKGRCGRDGQVGLLCYLGAKLFVASFHVFDLVTGEALNVRISGIVCVCLFCFKSLGKAIV